MAARKKPAVPEKVQLLSEENHPVLGHVERWFCTDGKVWRFGPEGAERE